MTPTKKLMQDMGSKTGAFNPEPPDHLTWRVNHSNSDVERCVAIVEAHCITVGHMSAWATDEQGKPLAVRHIASIAGWKEQTARNVLKEAEDQGRIRLEKAHRNGNGSGDGRGEQIVKIWLCADVPQARERRTTGEEDHCVQSGLPDYVVEFIENLKPDRRETFKARYTLYLGWKDKLFADGMAALRAVDQQAEDTIFSEFGGNKKRIAKRRDPDSDQIRIELLKPPEFVQSWTTPSLHTVEKPVVQTGASLLSSDPDRDFKYSSSSVVAPGVQTDEEEGRNPIFQKLQELHPMGASLEAAQSLLKACRLKSPDVTPEEIAAICHEVMTERKQLRQGVANPTGFCLTAVPLRFPAALVHLRARSAPPVPKANGKALAHVACPRCSNSGFVGAQSCNSADEAKKLIGQKRQICSCTDGQFWQEFAKDALGVSA